MAKKISKVLASERDYKVRPFALVDHEHEFYPNTVADIAARDAIVAPLRYEGVIVYVKSDQTTYQLRGGSANANWITLVDNDGATSHTTLADIGSYTHVQIDSHIDDATLHFTEASITITESQISDLGAYALASHNHDAAYLGITDTAVAADALATTGASVDVSAAAPPVAGQILTAVSATAATWQNAAAAGIGDIVQTGSPIATHIGYFTADKNLSGDAGLTWVTASALLSVIATASPEIRIQDSGNPGTTMTASLSFWDSTGIAAEIRMDGTGDLRIENADGEIRFDTGTSDVVVSGNGDLSVGNDLNITGYITGYGGTPANGSTLQWVTANGRAEFTLGAVMATGTPVNNQVAIWTAANTIEGDALFTWDGADLIVGAVFWDGSAAQLLLGDGTLGAPGLEIDGSATATPYVNLSQAGTVRAMFRFSDGSDRVEISSTADDITLRPGNVDTVTITQAALTAGNFVLNIDQTVGVAEDGMMMVYDDATGEIGLTDTVHNIVAGEPGNEGSGITINGSAYDSHLKVSDIGDSHPAQMILHRHSTTLPNIIVGARTKDATSSHTIVADNDHLLNIIAAGWDGVDYAISSEIQMRVDGVPGIDDMPGEIAFLTSPDGSHTAAERGRFFSGGLEVTGDITLTGTVDGVDVAALDTAYTAHAADATIHFTEASIDIPLTQGANDVTATFGELNLLDLAGLTVGWVLSADSATTASWKAPTGGSGTIGGSITDNQVAVGATTADDIEGSASFTWDAAHLVVGNYEFDADQTVGVSEDNYVLTYNDTTGLISLEAATGGGGSIGGAITDNQVAVGATAANDIEGDSTFTYNKGATTTDQLAITGNAAITSGALLSVVSDVATKAGAVVSFIQEHASGAGSTLYVRQDDSGSAAVEVVSATASRSLALMSLNVSNATGGGGALTVNNAQSGYAIEGVTTNAAGRAASFFSNVASRTDAVVTITNNQATGSGNALDVVDNMTGGYAIETSGANLGIKMTGGLLLTERADHANTPAATFGELWLRNDATQTLMFTDDAGTDYDLLAGGGGIGGSITDNQVAVGATTADDIEGDTGLTYTKGTQPILRLSGTNGPQFDMSGGQPQFRMEESDQTLDQKNWMRLPSAGALYNQIYDDAYVNAYTWMQVERSGTGAGVQVDTIDFTAETDVTLNTPTLVVGNGVAASQTDIEQVVDDGLMTISGGSSTSTGANLFLYGGTHASTAYDFSISANSGPVIAWDESAGGLTLYTGVAGAKAPHLTMGATGTSTFVGQVTIPTASWLNFVAGGATGIREQSAGVMTFKAGSNTTMQVKTASVDMFEPLNLTAATTAYPSLNMPEGVAPTAPVDGDHWLTAAGEYFVRLNGVSVDLAAGGGGIGGSITDNQIAVGATTADDIEGSANLTYDGTSLNVDSGRIDINGTLAQIRLEESDAAAEEKNWMLLANGGTLIWHMYNDGYTLEDRWLAVDRTGRAHNTTTLYTNGDVAAFVLSDGQLVLDGRLTPPASTTSRASMRIAHGTAPTVPVNGDLWTTTAGMFLHTNGTTVGPFIEAGAGIGGSITNDQVAFGAATADDIEGDDGLKFNNSFHILTVGDGTIANSARLALNGNATSSPNINFQQVGVSRAAVSFSDVANNLQITCVPGDIIFEPSETLALTLNSSTGAQLHDGGLRFLERSANAHTAAATFGEIWVRNDAPNVLVFTDDDDTDWVLNTISEPAFENQFLLMGA